MNYYYITGTSKGIGKAFAEYLLNENQENFVFGISRNCSIDHLRYTHIELDLSDVNTVKNFSFKDHPEAKKIMLINNAGAISDIKHIGKIDSDAIIIDYNVNLVSLALLTNSFISAFTFIKAEKIIVNISSGAGKSPIDGWSVYCSSKAGLDMFSRVVHEEQKLINNNFKIFSIAPGIVDTNMQDQIRAAVKENFTRIEDFIEYKNTGKLTDPDVLASKFFRILANTQNIHETIFSVRDFD